MPVIATWDDHDYGENDAGREFPFKAESKEIFLKFWSEPDPSPRREHAGIYTSYLFEDEAIEKRLQVILLDTRSFRDPPTRNELTSWKNEYRPGSQCTTKRSWAKPSGHGYASVFANRRIFASSEQVFNSVISTTAGNLGRTFRVNFIA